MGGIILRSATPEFAQVWNAVVAEHRERDQAWIASLRARGIKAAHPNDGWNDREECILAFVFPYFDDSAGVGDEIAIGGPDSYRVVRVTERVRPWLLDLYDTKRLRYTPA